MLDQNKQNEAEAVTITWVGYKTKDLVWTIGLVIASIIAPAALAHTPQNQWIIGTIVNSILFLSAWRLGIANSILVAALPSSVALLRGLLPAPMALLIPFIIISNILLVVIFNTLKKRIVFAGISASLAKFGFLYAITLFFAGKIATPFILMLQWPQLVTALAGWIVAMGVIKAGQRYVKFPISNF